MNRRGKLAMLFVGAVALLLIAGELASAEDFTEPVPPPTATVTYLPIVLTPGAYELQCDGELIVSEQYVICEGVE